MNKSFLVETSVIIAYLKNLPQGTKILTKLSGQLVSSVICLGELYQGVFLVSKKDKQKVKNGIDKFFQSLNAILPISPETAKIFGEVRASLLQKGRAIPDLDLLIAATCLSENLTLVTLNLKHFKRIPGLKLHPLS